MSKIAQDKSTDGAKPAMLKCATHIEKLVAYQPVNADPLIDLPTHGTERPVLTADLRSFAQVVDADSIAHYPDKRALEDILAGHVGVGAERVLVTAGADEALDRCCRAMLSPGHTLLTTAPTFVMTPHFAHLSGADVRAVPWSRGSLPVGELVAQIDATVRVIVITTPNNPTGLVATGGDVAKLAHAAPHALLVLDMAYGEYADHDFVQDVINLPNVVIVRTLSKAWGMPGIRLGYAVARANVISWLRASGAPFTVARPSLAIAHVRLRTGLADMRVYVERVRQERRLLEQHLADLGVVATPSQANFVLARFDNAAFVTDALRSLGVGARDFADPVLEGHRRITCPGEQNAFTRLCNALSSATRPRAILFDLDGVLADVSHSYRAAVLATAAEFGITLTAEDVSLAKAAGSANNDWMVTQRLLAERGVKVTLEQVTAAFERHYQGTDERPGLRHQERMLCDTSLLAALADRLPLAVVTGRPQKDASRFLQDADIARYFQTVVCMEDAPLKPDPAPVRLALTRLGVQAAWMIGDTPDDVRAARGAGVVPLGIVAPGDAQETMTRVLLRAGAARVLHDVSALSELLP